MFYASPPSFMISSRVVRYARQGCLRFDHARSARDALWCALSRRRRSDQRSRGDAHSGRLLMTAQTAPSGRLFQPLDDSAHRLICADNAPQMPTNGAIERQPKYVDQGQPRRHTKSSERQHTCPRNAQIDGYRGSVGVRCAVRSGAAPQGFDWRSTSVCLPLACQPNRGKPLAHRDSTCWPTRSSGRARTPLRDEDSAAWRPDNESFCPAEVVPAAPVLRRKRSPLRDALAPDRVPARRRRTPYFGSPRADRAHQPEPSLLVGLSPVTRLGWPVAGDQVGAGVVAHGLVAFKRHGGAGEQHLGEGEPGQHLCDDLGLAVDVAEVSGKEPPAESDGHGVHLLDRGSADQKSEDPVVLQTEQQPCRQRIPGAGPLEGNHGEVRWNPETHCPKVP
jgi:hypothetical protein